MFWHRRAFVGVLLCSGVFIITAAIIRAVVTLSASPSATTVNSWSVRETIVGLLAINLPILRPLFTFNFWKRGPFIIGQANNPNQPRNEGPIRRAIKSPFITSLSLSAILNTTRSKVTFSSVLQVEGIHMDQEVEAARPEGQLPEATHE